MEKDTEKKPKKAERSPADDEDNVGEKPVYTRHLKLPDTGVREISSIRAEVAMPPSCPKTLDSWPEPGAWEKSPIRRIPHS